MFNFNLDQSGISNLLVLFSYLLRMFLKMYGHSFELTSKFRNKGKTKFKKRPLHHSSLGILSCTYGLDSSQWAKRRDVWTRCRRVKKNHHFRFVWKIIIRRSSRFFLRSYCKFWIWVNYFDAKGSNLLVYYQWEFWEYEQKFDLKM